MWRFVLHENIRRYRSLIATARSDAEREQFRQLANEAEAELIEIEEVSTPGFARRDEALKFFAERSVTIAMERHNAQFASLQIHDAARAQLTILAQRNFRAPFLHHLASMRPGDGSACGECLAKNGPIGIADVNSHPGFEPHREAAREAGFEAVQAAPVHDRSGRPMAVLSTYFGTVRFFSGGDLDRMARSADSIGPDLERYLRA